MSRYYRSGSGNSNNIMMENNEAMETKKIMKNKRAAVIQVLISPIHSTLSRAENDANLISINKNKDFIILPDLIWKPKNQKIKQYACSYFLLAIYSPLLLRPCHECSRVNQQVAIIRNTGNFSTGKTKSERGGACQVGFHWPSKAWSATPKPRPQLPTLID